MSEARTLQSLALRYTWRRRAAGGALVAAAAALALAIAGRFGAGGAGRSLIVIVPVLVAAGVAMHLARRRIDGSAIARHLDRSNPAFEESAELLLLPPDSLPLTDRLERERAVRAFLREPVSLTRLPDRTATGLALAAAGLLLLTAAERVMPASTSSFAPGTEASASAASRAPRVTDVSITIAPPAYTGRPARRQRDWDVDAEEGARIEWEVRFDGAAPLAAIVTAAGDTARLEPRGDRYAGALTARKSTLYQLHTGSVAAHYRSITVRPDGAPSVTVLRPAPRSEIAPGGSHRVSVEVLARDEYGIADVTLVATVTTGEGEGVRFREQRLELGEGRGVPAGVVYRRILDLDSLGMTPGDELYFHALARDSRRPRPNEGRSETVFIALQDTAAAATAEFSGLALSTLPEYFRSQRQIIIDTERLIADAARLPVDVFRERANAIGMDQALLRLRYGAFTGEEFEAESEPDATHEHDSEENATLLAPSTKATLKGAIAEMWQAELRLRTYRPRDALPYEYRALDLLKAVQQASRSYVQRVGFEPPPLEPDRKRLTGSLAGVASRTVIDSARPSVDPAAIASVLTRVRALAAGAPPRASDAGLLAEAAATIARQPVERDERQINAIRSLDALADSIRAGRRCLGCAVATERALLARLAEPQPAPPTRSPVPDLTRRYFELLESAP